jgi:3'(2'), 5'-bisphosphate nucleotidase
MLKIDRYFLFSLLETAVEAGRAILHIYNTDFSVSFKDDHSPLTLADRRSNEIITSRLSQPPFHRFPLLSEEGRDIPYAERRSWEYFWLVDPLDGTKEFVRRNGEFTVNIALIHRGRAVLGIIYVPVKDIFYYAAEELGAYRLILGERANRELSIEDVCRDSDRLPLPVLRPREKGKTSAVTLIASRSHLSPETEDFISRVKKRHGEVRIISSGSSIKFCLIAEGSADIYPRFGPTMEWDTAAGQCIVEEAGGEVLHAETLEPLTYNKKNLLNPWFIVTGDQQAHRSTLSGILTNQKK